jgi:hypothetical protein
LGGCLGGREGGEKGLKKEAALIPGTLTLIFVYCSGIKVSVPGITPELPGIKNGLLKDGNQSGTEVKSTYDNGEDQPLQ